MKHIKKFFYLLAVLSAFVLLLFLGTAATQLIMMAISAKIRIAISDDFLYHMSGNMGTAITAIVFAAYVKKKKYIQRTETTEPFHLAKALVLMGLSLCICMIIADAVTTLLFANCFPIAKEQTITNITPINLFLTIIIAPVFEELLFRMGFYNLLLRKFSRTGSIIICALLFAVIHGYQLQGLISCLIAGLVFTLIYAKTGNILYCICAHGICNLFATIMNALEDMGATLFGMALQYEINGYNMLHPVFIIIAMIFCGTFILSARKTQIHQTVS